MSIIIRRPYANLERELRSTFEGQEDVNVIVDRRYGERRTSRQTIEMDRRPADRRGPKEELVEVVISTWNNRRAPVPLSAGFVPTSAGSLHSLGRREHREKFIGHRFHGLRGSRKIVMNGEEMVIG